MTIEENEIIGQVSLEPLTFQPVHGSQQDINARHAPDKGKPYSFLDGLAQDGGLLNEQYAYEEIFGFQFLDGKPFYFYKRDGQIHLSYNNEDLPVVYDELPHYRCCSGAALNPTAGINWIGFWGQRDGI